MSELRKLLEAATPGPWEQEDGTWNIRCTGQFIPIVERNLRVEDAAIIVHLCNNAETYAGMEEENESLRDLYRAEQVVTRKLEERIAELESQLEASLGALREQMKARRDACARLGAVEGGLRIAAIYVRAALQGDGGQE